MGDKTEVRVSDEEEQHRYEAHVDGALAGFAAYELSDGTITFTHTEVDDRYEGLGVGSALARLALDDVAEKGERKVVPQCSFIAGWIDKHPEYTPLVKETDVG